MAVISRRAALALPALGLARRRRRVAMRPDDTGLGFFQIVTVAGSGVFVYSGTPAAGNLVASVAAAAGTDPYGNAYVAGLTSYDPAVTKLFVEISAQQIIFGSQNANSRIALNGNISAGDALTDSVPPQLAVIAPATSGRTSPNLTLFGASKDGTSPSTAILTSPFLVGGTLADTTATLEVQAAAGVTALELIPTAGGNIVLASRIAADTNDRLTSDGNGQFSWGPGNAVTDSQLHRLAANSMSFKTCDLSVETLGRGFRAREGANCKQGTATLSGGTILVANTSVTAVSRIFLTPQDNSTIGALRISARVAGTSFTITSSNAGDSGVVAFEIFEPA